MDNNNDDDDDDTDPPPPLDGGVVGNNILLDDLLFDDFLPAALFRLDHHVVDLDDVDIVNANDDDDDDDDDDVNLFQAEAPAAAPRPIDNMNRMHRIIGGFEMADAPLMVMAPPPVMPIQRPPRADVALPRRVAPLLAPPPNNDNDIIVDMGRWVPHRLGNIDNLDHWGGGGGDGIVNDDLDDDGIGLRRQRVMPMGRLFHPRNNLPRLQLMNHHPLRQAARGGGAVGGGGNQIMQGHGGGVLRRIAAPPPPHIEDAEIAAAVAEILNEHHNNVPDPNAFDINTTFVYLGPPPNNNNDDIVNNPNVNNNGRHTTTITSNPPPPPPIPQNVQYIRIDESVKRIPENAFLHQHNLKHVVMHDDVEEIGPYAFGHCIRLRGIIVPSKTHTICQYAFAYCERLTSVIFGGEEAVVVAVNDDADIDNDDDDDNNVVVLEGKEEEEVEKEKDDEEGGGEGGESMLCTIGEMAFARCYSLQRILIPKGIRTIGIAAFKCTPLHTIVIGGGDSSSSSSSGDGVLSNNIDDDTFYDSYSESPVDTLTIMTREKDDKEDEVEITTIGDAAFANNRYTNFRLPPLISTMSPCLFRSCRSLFSMEVPPPRGGGGGVEHYGSQALAWCPYLRNVAISHTAIIDEGVFFGCTDLQDIFGSNEHKIIFALRHRFDDLPDHENLYYRSYRDQCQWSTDCDINGGGGGGGNTTYHKQDCLGMTQLHILACSSPTTSMKSLDKTLELYHFLVEKHPQSLITEDKWGTVPLLYAIWSCAPKDVIQFLVDSYKLHHPDYVFDWTAMVDLLLRANAPMDRIHNIANINESHYPDYPIDWDSLLESDTAPFDRAVDHSGYFLNRFRYLVSRGLTKRINAISVRQWREYMLDLLEKAPFRYNKQNNYFILDGIRTKLVHFEGRSQELNAACYLLEVALWKKKLFEAGEEDRELLTDACEQMKIDGSFNFREHCRISCGAGIIIGHVLPYLMHSTVDDELRSSSGHVE